MIVIRQIRLAVGSQNPVKIEAARQGLADCGFEIAEIRGFNAPSGVPDQPVGETETAAGAENRARFLALNEPNFDFYIGIEGGISRESRGTAAFACIFLCDREGRESFSKTGFFYLPKALVDFLDQGMELGEADDRLFGKTDSKKGLGSVGLLTGGAVNRELYYRQAVSLAAIPFLHPEFYA